MDRDEFIISVYCLVCEHYRALTAARPLRRGGFAPALTDEEVLTLEVCGECFKLGTDKDLYGYFATHYRHFFPRLPSRTAFVRQAAALWQVALALQRRLTWVSGQASQPVQVIDTLPVPVCAYTRAKRERCFKPDADYGYCSAKRLHYYGFKLGLRIAPCGMLLDCPLLPARPHDLQLLDDLLEGFTGVAPADKGFIDAYRQALWAERHGVHLITPPRQGHPGDPAPYPPAVLRAAQHIRKLVETVASPLTERFAVARIRVHDLWHFQHRLIRKVLAHTVVVWLNLRARRPPLDLDGLVTA